MNSTNGPKMFSEIINNNSIRFFGSIFNVSELRGQLALQLSTRDLCIRNVSF